MIIVALWFSFKVLSLFNKSEADFESSAPVGSSAKIILA